MLSLSKNNVGKKEMAVSLVRVNRFKGKTKTKGSVSDIFTFDLTDSDIKIMKAKNLELKYKVRRKKIKVNCSLSDS